MRTHLTTYLNDHLAGSVAAVELLDRLVEHATVSDVRETLSGLRSEIEADQATLREVLTSAGGEPSTVRQVGAWLAEKAGQLKLRADDPGADGLARLEAFEMLALGIQGKASLWRALAAVQPAWPALGAYDFGSLERRALEQYPIAERFRLEAARAALHHV
jgi:hypothetical protein